MTPLEIVRQDLDVLAIVMLAALLLLVSWRLWRHDPAPPSMGPRLRDLGLGLPPDLDTASEQPELWLWYRHRWTKLSMTPEGTRLAESWDATSGRATTDPAASAEDTPETS